MILLKLQLHPLTTTTKNVYIYQEGDYLKAGRGGWGAINFGTTRRPVNWTDRGGVSTNAYHAASSGVDDEDDHHEYLSLNYLGLYSDGETGKSKIKYYNAKKSEWEAFYPTTSITCSGTVTRKETIPHTKCADTIKIDAHTPAS